MATLGINIRDRYSEYLQEGGPSFPDHDEPGMTLFEFYVGQALASFSPGERYAPDPADAADWAIQTAVQVMSQLEDRRAILATRAAA